METQERLLAVVKALRAEEDRLGQEGYELRVTADEVGAEEWGLRESEAFPGRGEAEGAKSFEAWLESPEHGPVCARAGLDRQELKVSRRGPDGEPDEERVWRFVLEDGYRIGHAEVGLFETADEVAGWILSQMKDLAG